MRVSGLRGDAQSPSPLTPPLSPPGRGSVRLACMAGKRLTPVARQLRRDMTDCERVLWSRLRGSQLDGCKFVRQFAIGPAIADFACRSARLVIELDGGQHTEATEADAERTRLIEVHGYTVIRFWNSDGTSRSSLIVFALSIVRKLLCASGR